MSTITSATAAECPAAFDLALQHVPAGAGRAGTVRNALTLLAGGEIDPEGIFVARQEERLCGVQVAILLRGASGLLWLPRTAPPDADLEDRLVQAALDWLRRRGAKLAQAIVHPDAAHEAAPLLRRGFQHVTRLRYLELNLDKAPQESPPLEGGAKGGSRLRLETYAAQNSYLFKETILRSYEGTLDCPELNGIRTIEEVVAGHIAQGHFRPERWWLAFEQDRPVGVALTTEVPDLGAWDLSYVGIVPEARRRGLGRAVTTHILHAASAAGVHHVSLAVDRRNLPAWNMYAHLGFTPFDHREVYLRFF